MRFLPIFFGVVFALTLFFAVAAGAQVQVQEVQQQQVPDNQQQILEVQQQQQDPNDQQQAVEVQQQQVGPAAAPAPQEGPLAGARVIIRKDTRPKDFIDKGDVLRIKGNYDVEAGASITIENAAGDQALFVDGRNAEITETDFGLEIRATKDPLNINGEPFKLSTAGGVQAVNSDGVRREQANQGGGGGGGNPTNPTNPTNPVTPTQDTTDTTTTDTTTTDTTDSALETTTADDANLNAELNRPDADNFRCDFFLRAVRDDRGALRDQYVGDELIVQRFEQCLSEDVLADTIPDRKLPFTGGPLLPPGGGLLLLVAAAVLAARIIWR